MAPTDPIRNPGSALVENDQAAERRQPQAEVSEGVVVAFAVDDIVGARDELAAARVEMIGELVWANELLEDPNMEGFGWFFFRGPDGNVYVIQQDGRPDAA
jgi:hypothetical protein